MPAIQWSFARFCLVLLAAVSHLASGCTLCSEKPSEKELFELRDGERIFERGVTATISLGNIDYEISATPRTVSGGDDDLFGAVVSLGVTVGDDCARRFKLAKRGDGSKERSAFLFSGKRILGNGAVLEFDEAGAFGDSKEGVEVSPGQTVVFKRVFPDPSGKGRSGEKAFDFAVPKGGTLNLELVMFGVENLCDGNKVSPEVASVRMTVPDSGQPEISVAAPRGY